MKIIFQSHKENKILEVKAKDKEKIPQTKNNKQVLILNRKKKV
jgi:hypothetical protein